MPLCLTLATVKNILKAGIQTLKFKVLTLSFISPLRLIVQRTLMAIALLAIVNSVQAQSKTSIVPILQLLLPSEEPSSEEPSIDYLSSNSVYGCSLTTGLLQYFPVIVTRPSAISGVTITLSFQANNGVDTIFSQSNLMVATNSFGRAAFPKIEFSHLADYGHCNCFSD